jgi:hypothetical protein
MNILFTALLFLTTLQIFGQPVSRIDSLDFCGYKIPVPHSCKAESPNQIKCDDYSMVWSYLQIEMMPTFVEKLVNNMAAKFKDFKKTEVVCYFSDNEVKGYKISFDSGYGTAYQLFAYGEAMGQAVVVQLTLNKKPETNADIPEFPKQIVRLAY